MAVRAVRIAFIVCLTTFVLACSGLTLAIQERVLPAFTWRMPLGDREALIIHNGPMIDCLDAMQSKCIGAMARHNELSVHYVTSVDEQVLLTIR